MPPPISREVRAFAFGLMKGVGGVSYNHRDTSALLKERFNVTVSPKTLRNWKSDMVNQMSKYAITEDYIQELIGKGLSGALRDEDTNGVTPKDESEDEVPGPIDEELSPGSDDPWAGTLPQFASLADVVGFMEGQGFIVATSDQDLREILRQSGLTVLEKGALRFGPEIISVDPIEMDFEVVGKKIAGNPVIMWYYALARKLAVLTGEDPPELDLFVTGCVVDAMVARKWNMAVLRA